mgnify:FL=1
MAETIYIDRCSAGSSISVIFTQETEVIDTGLSISSERNRALAAEVSRLCGMSFLLEGQVLEVPLYAVPYLEVFASDGRSGWFAATSEGGDGPLYHINRDRSVCLLSDCYRAFFNEMISDPDWRQKRLPGGPWPRLPEDPEGRKELAAELGAPVPSPKKTVEPGPLPRVFASREEAEREFPVLDIWTVLRQEREPRFQIHPMMSPGDREGRAFVHYTAWREAYTGLMPEAILKAHTLERCRESAQWGSSDDTFVALDREDGDQVVGFATLCRSARDFVSVPEAGEIAALYVLQEYQGLGLGRQLLEHCLAWIPRPRALFVLEGNEKAIRFYEHMGFRPTGHRIVDERDGDTLVEIEMCLERDTHQ